MRLTSLALAAALVAGSQFAHAGAIFTATGTVLSGTTSQTRDYSFSRAEDLFDTIDFDNLSAGFTNYTGTQIARLDMNFRGLPMQVAFNTPNSTTLTFSVPALGIQQTFTGTTRDASQDQFVDFMEKNGGDILNRIYKKLAEVSPNDPVAGNPNSLMGRMVANDFNTAFNEVGTNIGPGEAGSKQAGLVGIGAQFSSIRQNGTKSDSLTIPLSYTIRNDIDPRRQFIINVPVNYSTVEGSKSASIGIGGAYRYPVNDNWTLTPSLSYGVAVSRDQAALGQAVSGSLTSTYIFRKVGNAEMDVVVGNMVGLFRTVKISSGDYSYDPGISNTLFRNGVMLSQPVSVGGKKMAIEYSLIDTKFTGTALYNMHYDEISVTLGTNKASSSRSFFRAGATYLFSPQTKGLTLNLGYWF